MRLRRLLLPVLALSLAGCEGTSIPDGVDGRYSITRTAEGRLPILFTLTGPEGSGLEFVSGDLTLRQGSQVEFVVKHRLRDEEGRIARTDVDTLRSTYVLYGDQVRIYEAVASAGFYRLSDARIVDNRRIDAVLNVGVSHYSGWIHIPLDVTLTR